MDSFPQYKTFMCIFDRNFVPAEYSKNCIDRPQAVTIYEDYTLEEIFSTIVEELYRQIDNTCFAFANAQDCLEGRWSLILNGKAHSVTDLSFDMFENGIEYVCAFREKLPL